VSFKNFKYSSLLPINVLPEKLYKFWPCETMEIRKTEIVRKVRSMVKYYANVHSFAVGGAIPLLRPWRRVLNCDTKDKILFKSVIDKCRPVHALRHSPLLQNFLL
jgi:hypothetical protein